MVAPRRLKIEKYSPTAEDLRRQVYQVTLGVFNLVALRSCETANKGCVENTKKSPLL